MARFVVGVTGGVASGKSAVTALFQGLGVEVADADLAAREVVAPGQPALEEIERRFGPDFLLANGMLNRVRMRALVFENAQARRDLEAITHPRIRDILRTRCQAATSPYAIAAIPLLAESGVADAYAWLDRRLVVDCSAAVQLGRLLARDAIDEALASSMIASQVRRDIRLAMATDVIENDAGLAELATAVRRLDKFYRLVAADSRSMD
jgi:dephospho-CoA kinase